jgi:GAF domain-containing protein
MSQDFYPPLRGLEGPLIVDEAALRRVMAEYVTTVVGSYGIGQMLYRLTEQCLEVLGCDGAGVSLGGPEGRLEFVTATSAVVTHVEKQQLGCQQGPCHEAFKSGEQVVVNDLAEMAEVWPDYARDALEQGCRAAVGVPMSIAGEEVGALNLYRFEAHRWTREELEVGQSLANMAAGYIANLRELNNSRQLADQLQQALDSRIVIEQAKGIIAARRHIDMDAAFQLLRRMAQDRQRRIHDVASDVIEGRLPP